MVEYREGQEMDDIIDQFRIGKGGEHHVYQCIGPDYNDHRNVQLGELIRRGRCRLCRSVVDIGSSTLCCPIWLIQVTVLVLLRLTSTNP